MYGQTRGSPRRYGQQRQLGLAMDAAGLGGRHGGTAAWGRPQRLAPLSLYVKGYWTLHRRSGSSTDGSKASVSGSVCSPTRSMQNVKPSRSRQRRPQLAPHGGSAAARGERGAILASRPRVRSPVWRCGSAGRPRLLVRWCGNKGSTGAGSGKGTVRGSSAGVAFWRSWKEMVRGAAAFRRPARGAACSAGWSGSRDIGRRSSPPPDQSSSAATAEGVGSNGAEHASSFGGG